MNPEEKEKHLDNKIDKNVEEANYKKELDIINDKIYAEKSKFEDINEMEDIMRSLNKSISECVEILRDSMSGDNINYKLNSIEESNTVNFNNTIYDFDDRRDEINKKISKLYKEKMNLEDKHNQRKENIEEDKHNQRKENIEEDE